MKPDRLFDSLLNKNTLEKAFDYLLVEIEGSSLALDPIWTPALSAIKKNREEYFNALSELLKSGNYKADKATYFRFPKDNLGIRPVAVISITDRIVYQAIFLKPVLGNILKTKYTQPPCYTPNLSTDEEKTFLEDWHIKWDSYIKDQIEAYKEGYKYKVDLDVKSFFDNINHRLIKDFLVKDCSIDGTKVVDILFDLLTTWAHKPGFGIPQGPEASIFLASAFLSQLDDKATSLMSELDFKQFRYNDDICLMAKNPEILHLVIEILSNFLFDIFLELNGKTSFTLLSNEEVSKLDKRRIYSPYNTYEDSLYTLLNIEADIPGYIKKLQNSKKLEQYEISALKYYLKGARNRIYCTKFIDLLDKAHSLSLYICRYVQKFVDAKEVYDYLYATYTNKHLYSWTKFWVLKTLIASTHFSNELNILDSKQLILNCLNDKSWEIRSLSLYIGEIFGFIDDSENSILKIHKATDNIFEKQTTAYILGNKKKYNVLLDSLREDSNDLQIIAFNFLNKEKETELPLDIENLSKNLFKISQTMAETQENVELPNTLLDLVSEKGGIKVSVDTSKLKQDLRQELGLTWAPGNNGKLKKSNNIEYWLEMRTTGELIINGTYMLSKPNIDSENENFISYVYNRPNKETSRKEICESQNTKLTRPFNNILNDLGFKGEIKKLFFPVSSADKVRFFNKLKHADVISSGVDKTKLQKQLSKLKKIS